MRCRFMTLPGFLTRCLIVAGAVAVGQVAYCATSQADPPFPQAEPTPPALAPICGERTEIIAKLAKNHDEAPEAIGLGADGGVIEVLVAPGGSFTILVTYPKRPTCVVAVGQAWQSLTHLLGRPA